MMSARVASALALVSLSVCFAREHNDSNASFPAAEEAFQPELTHTSASSSIKEANSQTTTHEWLEHASLEPFRFGSVTSKRVRMRTAAQLDAPVICELNKGTPLKITAETSDFYAIVPPLPMKAYVFRTYVLDGKIEGERVNVRLGPSAEAPILTQLSSGYPVNGKPSQTNPKWLEIDLPATTRFYISRDYVQLIDERTFAELAQNFQSVKSGSQAASVAKAEQTPSKQEAETYQPEPVSVSPPTKEPEPVKAVEPVKIATIEQKSTSHLTRWQVKEQNLQNQWLLLHAPSTAQNYQDVLQVSAKRLKGILEPYVAPEDAPGDYLLRDGSRVIAIVYSAEIDLATYIGESIELKVIERSNSSYAYPAFCVLEVL